MTLNTKMRNRYTLLLFALLMLTLTGCAQTKYLSQDSVQIAEDQWWCYPLPGAKVISPFGGARKHHSGVDIKTKPNDEIHAAFDGEVIFSKRYAGYGNLIRIQHPNGLETYYSHNSKNLVKVGDHVKAGQVIALTGQTGRATTPHLHFETRVNGRAIDPARYFDHANHTIRLKAFTKTAEGYRIKKGK